MATGTTGSTGATGPVGGAPTSFSFNVTYRTTTGTTSIVVSAPDRERAIETALSQISVPDGGSVEIIQTAMQPAGAAGPTGATGA
jgi:hypothetical protein